MSRWFDRALDRELGPEPGRSAPARDPWLRDWPLLLGLLLSASLIVGSMAVRGSQAKPVEPAKEAVSAASQISGDDVVDVGEDEAAVPDAPSPKKAPGKKKDKAKKKAAAADPSSAQAEVDATPSADPETDTSSGSSGGSTRRPAPSTTNPGGGSGGGVPVPGKIVNVTGTSAAYTNGPLSYNFKAPTHTPTVGKPWILSVGAKRSGAPLRGTVRINILHQGKVVGKAANGPLKNGRFAHRFDWPKQAVGHPLTIQTSVIGGGIQQSFLFSVKVKAAG